MSRLIVLQGVRTVQLNRAQNTLIDESDLELIPKRRFVSQCKSPTNTYAIIRGHIIHRLIMGLLPRNPLVVDHRNGDPMDNRRANLRICTQAQNILNKRIIGRFGYKNVNFKYNSDGLCYTASVMENCGDSLCLGRFGTAEEAARAYDEYAVENYGEFACTNAMMGLYDENRPVPPIRKSYNVIRH